jgi:hypothetical protein
MGFRVHRSIRLLPGVRLNLSKSGVSASIGTRGAWLTFGKRGTRATVGIPGTGISYTQTLQPHSEHQDAVQAPEAASRSGTAVRALFILLTLLAIAGGVGWIIGVAMR